MFVAAVKNRLAIHMPPPFGLTSGDTPTEKSLKTGRIPSGKLLGKIV
jgi:hypothetical protein